MGFWENKDEYYPDTEDFDICGLVGGVPTNLSQLPTSDPNYVASLRNEKVRHHKVPGSRVLYTIDDLYAKKAIGLSFNNIQIPDEIADQVESFYFCFAKRDVRNSTVLGTSVILPQARWQWNTGSQSNATTTVVQRGYKVYPHHLMTEQPVVGVNYIKADFRLRDYATYGDDQQHDVEIKVDYVYPEYFTIEAIYGHEYLRQDNTAHDFFNNAGREAGLFLNSVNKISGYPVYSPFTQSLLKIFQEIATNGYNVNNYKGDVITELKYGTIRSFLENIYVNFYDQDLGSTNTFFPVTGSGTYTASNVYNWDTFNGQRMQYYKRNAGTTTMTNAGDADQWVYKLRIFHREYTTNNIFFNQLEGGIDTDKSIGHTYDYDKSYNSINDRKTLVAYNPYLTYINKLPYRVYLSVPQQDEDKSFDWIIIYSSYYYEMPRNRCQIWCIRGQNLTAYIQMEGALFHTSVNDVIKTDTLIAYLQASDLFDRPPAELAYSNEGYIGCNDMFSCLVTPQGYFVYDRKRRRVFNVKDGKVGIVSDVGYKEYFLDNGELSSTTLDNPYNNQGAFIVYDDEFNRMIINLCQITVSGLNYRTLSLDTQKGAWVGEHTYNPTMMYSLRDGTYAVTNTGQIFKINDRTKFARYFDNTPNESYFEIVFNHMRDVEKVFESTDWETEVLNATGVDLHDKTFTHIMVYDSHHCTGIVNLANNTTWFNEVKSRLRTSWYYGKFRDLVDNVALPFLDNRGNVITSNININKSFFKKSKFIGKFIVVRFIYDNVDGNEILVNNVGVNYRHYRN